MGVINGEIDMKMISNIPWQAPEKHLSRVPLWLYNPKLHIITTKVSATTSNMHNTIMVMKKKNKMKNFKNWLLWQEFKRQNNENVIWNFIPGNSKLCQKTYSIISHLCRNIFALCELKYCLHYKNHVKLYIFKT